MSIDLFHFRFICPSHRHFFFLFFFQSKWNSCGLLVPGEHFFGSFAEKFTQTNGKRSMRLIQFIQHGTRFSAQNKLMYYNRNKYKFSPANAIEYLCFTRTSDSIKLPKSKRKKRRKVIQCWHIWNGYEQTCWILCLLRSADDRQNQFHIYYVLDLWRPLFCPSVLCTIQYSHHSKELKKVKVMTQMLHVH